MLVDPAFTFRFDWLHKKSGFRDLATRQQLLTKINAIPGVQFGEEVLTRRARIPLADLAAKPAMQALQEALTWLIETAEWQKTAAG